MFIVRQTDGEERYHNLGAVAVLRGPTWDEPGFVQYGAVLPRPEVQATYEVLIFYQFMHSCNLESMRDLCCFNLASRRCAVRASAIDYS